MLTDKQRELADLMGEISEECYYAGWTAENEHRLWSAVSDPADDLVYGAGVIDRESVDALRRLSLEVGGWIVWDEAQGRRFVPLDEWLKLYGEHHA